MTHEHVADLAEAGIGAARPGADAEIGGFVRAVGTVAKALGLEEPGYRLLANAGWDSHQEVPHLHVHVFGGRKLGPMLVRGGE